MSSGALALEPLVEPGPALTLDEIRRYARHLTLPQIGELGQRRLRNARVCVIGAGGLGAPVLLYLAAAGVGRLGIVDHDEVEVSNLQRQVIHGWADLGRTKLDSARDSVLAIDAGLDVVLHPVRLTEQNVDAVLTGYDLVIDGTDNFPTRYLVNDACVRLGLPEVWGSILRFDAQVSVFWGRPPAGSGATPVDLRDLFPEPPAPGTVASCAEGGVLGAMCGQVGSVMASEAIKLITGVGQTLLGRVLVLDVLAARWAEVPLVRSARAAAPATPAGLDRPVTQVAAADGGAADPRPARAVDRVPTLTAPQLADRVPTLTAPQLADRLMARDAGADEFALVDVREPVERAIALIPGSRLLPLGEVLAGRGLDDLPRDQAVVLYCHHGMRSEQALLALRALGYDDLSHLAGGIEAWADEVDPSLPRY